MTRVCTDGMFSQGEWQLLVHRPRRGGRSRPCCCWMKSPPTLTRETEARVLEALRRASAGRTVLSISHRIYEQLGGRMIEIRALDGEAGEGEGKDLNPA